MGRKMFWFILAALLLAASAALAEGAAHTHAPAEEWDRDLIQHWHACECGERLEAENHVIEEDWVRCTVCGSEIWEFGDGAGEIYNFDEYDQVIRCTSFEGEDAPAKEYRYLREYDDGFCTREEMYLDGILFSVTEYAMHRDGYGIPKLQIWYEAEGGRSVNEYDEEGSVVHMITYGADEAVTYEEFAEYTYDENGWVLGVKRTGYFDGVLSYEYESNEHGDSVLDLFYDEDGTVDFGSRTEYEYDENGNKLWEKNYDYVTGRLTRESTYAVEEMDDWEENYEATEICYEENGSKYVYEYDARGNELSETVYNADGEIETVYRSEYEFDEDGNVLLHNRYENERLCLVVQYEIIETEDWSIYYEKIRTEVYEDGSMYIWEYDENGEEVSAGLFDKGGNPVPEEEGKGE